MEPKDKVKNISIVMMAYPSNLHLGFEEGMKEKAVQIASFLSELYELDLMVVTQILISSFNNVSVNGDTLQAASEKILEVLKIELDEEEKFKILDYLLFFIAKEDGEGEIDEIEGNAIIEYANKLNCVQFIDNINKQLNDETEEIEESLNVIFIKPSTRVSYILSMLEKKYQKEFYISTLKDNRAGLDRKARALTVKNIKGGVSIEMSEDLQETLDRIFEKSGISVNWDALGI